MTNWKNKKIAVLGCGVEGLSSAKYLAKHGAKVTVFDEATSPDSERIAELKSIPVEFVTGENAFEGLGNGEYELIVRSPGIPLTHPMLVKAKEKELITSQTQLFMEACPCEVIGVTGTKGKGTTSSLIYEMLKKSGQDAYLGGNIGIPPLDFLDSLDEKSTVVLEMSSFQLEDITKSPHIAVMLMIVPEHLGADTKGTQNYHVTMEEYVTAKRNILLYQTPEDFAVINRDYLPSNESDIYTEGKVFYVTRERETTEQGCFVKDGAIWIRMQGAEWKIIDTADIALPGKHNFENACAAVMAATLAGATKAEVINVLRSFKGLPHRLELVREVDEVRFYDDSFSTTPETAMAAVEAFQEPEILILGGASKNSDFTELGGLVAKKENIKAIIGIGEEWGRIKSSIEQSAKSKKIIMIEGAKDMATIVQAAAKIAAPGDVVILSPGCTSFDMFKNYKDRGDQFKEEVKKL